MDAPSRPRDVLLQAMLDVRDMLRDHAEFDLGTASAEELDRFVRYFATVLLTEAREHGIHDHEKHCVFAEDLALEPTKPEVNLLAERIRKRWLRAKALTRHLPDKAHLADQRRQQLSRTPIEVGLRRAGRMTQADPAGHGWDVRPQERLDALWTGHLTGDHVKYAAEWERVMLASPRSDNRITEWNLGVKGSNWCVVTVHLFERVEVTDLRSEDDSDRELAERIRSRYFEGLAALLSLLWEMESKRWREIELAEMKSGTWVEFPPV